MIDLVKHLAVAAVVLVPLNALGQNPAAMQEVRAVATEWNRAYNARDVAAIVSLFDEKPIGLFVYGGNPYPRDSLRAMHERTWAARTNEAWTVDRADVAMLNDQTSLLTITWSGRYTTAAGVTWEYTSSAVATAVVQKRGNAWKIVAMHNAGSGTQVRR